VSQTAASRNQAQPKESCYDRAIFAFFKHCLNHCVDDALLFEVSMDSGENHNDFINTFATKSRMEKQPTVVSINQESDAVCIHQKHSLLLL